MPEAYWYSNSYAVCGMLSGWSGRQKGMMCNSMMVLMQAEVERFHAGVSLLHDYYHTKMQETSADETIISLVSNGIGQSCVPSLPS